MTFFDALLQLPRWQKRTIQVAIDCLLISLCYALAMWLRLDSWRFASNPETWYVLVPVIPVTLVIFVRTGFYRAVLRYIGNQAAWTVAMGITASAATMFVASQLFDWFVPRSVPIIYALLAIVMIGGSRLVWRVLYTQFNAPRRAAVVIYGAGNAGRQVAASLRNGGEYIPVAFLDDDPSLRGAMISGLRVYTSDHLPTLMGQHVIKVVLLALPETSRAHRKAILERLEPLAVQVQTIPDMGDLVTGRATVDDIRAVPVEDLLGRDPVPPHPELLAATITGKAVMVTGAGGSIGSELSRQILALSPKTLVLFEQSEFNLYRIEQELSDLKARNALPTMLHAVLGSVQNPVRTQATLDQHQINTVYHAAAYKHVPLVEDNVVEGVRNNIFGTLNLAKAAIATGVEAFILVSTDKAVRPTNVMGASKRMAELICQACAAEQDKTRFSMVRFGNVLGSSGSVIPRFRQQIAAGGPVTVTAPDITRYFMTIPEAAQLVIQAGALAKGGDVFVLDMGAPIKILDLALRMIRLSGLIPYTTDMTDGVSELDIPRHGDIEVVFTGLRSGEKRYEELLICDTVHDTVHPRIMTANEDMMDQAALDQILAQMLAAAKAFEPDHLKALLQAAPTGYLPGTDGS